MGALPERIPPSFLLIFYLRQKIIRTQRLYDFPQTQVFLLCFSAQSSVPPALLVCNSSKVHAILMQPRSCPRLAGLTHTHTHTEKNLTLNISYHGVPGQLRRRQEAPVSHQHMSRSCAKIGGISHGQRVGKISPTATAFVKHGPIENVTTQHFRRSGRHFEGIIVYYREISRRKRRGAYGSLLSRFSAINLRNFIK